MKGDVEQAKEEHLSSIRNFLCPICGAHLEKAISPSGASVRSSTDPFVHWDFYCLNADCGITWQIPFRLYEEIFAHKQTG